MNEQTVVNGNTVEVGEFDSHTTTKICKIMIVKSKITGRDISTEYLALMSGIITNDEFELITLTIK